MFHSFCSLSKIASQKNDVIYFPVCLVKREKQENLPFQNWRAENVVVAWSWKKKWEVDGNCNVNLRTKK